MNDWGNQWQDNDIPYGQPYIGNRHDLHYSKKQERHYRKQQKRYRREQLKRKLSKFGWVLMIIGLVILTVAYNVITDSQWIGPDVDNLTNR